MSVRVKRDSPFPTPVFLRRRMAGESVDPELLAQLACDESYWVRRQVLGNPAAPKHLIETLMRAGSTSDLRGLSPSDPELSPRRLEELATLGGFGRILAARHPATPAPVLESLLGDASPKLKRQIACHPNVAERALGTLCADIEEEVRTAARSNPRHPGNPIRLLQSAGASGDLRVAGWPLQEPSDDVLRELWQLGAWGRLLAIRRPACPQDLMEAAAADPDWRVRSGLLENPAAADGLLSPYLEDGHLTTAELRVLSEKRPSAADLARLLDHRDAEVRMAVARHPGVPEGILESMASDAERVVRALVAAQPRTPREAIERLVRAGSSPNLMEVAESAPGLTPAELEPLLSQGPWARLLVSRHPRASAGQLARLLCDPSPQIRQWALAHPNAPPQVVRDLIRCGSGDDLQGFHQAEPSMSPATLRDLATLGPWARRLVALHPATPLEVLEKLSEAREWEVRRNLARRGDLPASLRALLMGDSVEKVREAVLQNTDARK